MIHFTSHLKTAGRRTIASFFVLTLLFSSIGSVAPQKAEALSGNEFNPGFIISDSTFYNPYTMSSAAIQDWLNAQTPLCDTNGSQPSSHRNTAANRYYTRAEWGAMNGNPGPYVCLKDYAANVGAMAADGLCAASPGGYKTAAQMISDAAISCSINPKVLLVLLQKEQGLITDDWPWQSQYTAATGYACPDTAACNPAYAGLPNQLHWAAWQYQYYKANPTQFNFRAGRTQNIQFNPQASCGSAPVYIQNQATAGLYNYTPYQPNNAALNNLFGSGDNCSAYGNRNFWRMYSNWFGSSTADCSNDANSAQIQRLYDPKTFNHYYTTNACEIYGLTKNYGYVFEGPTFTVVNPSTPGATPVFRLYNKRTGLHFYTIFQSDVDSAVARSGFTYEGPSFYMASTNQGNATYPVYRLYNDRTGIHMWTPSQADIQMATTQAGYHLEGIAFYAN